MRHHACSIHGKHPSLTHSSYILYRKVEVREAIKLDAGFQYGLFTAEQPMNGQTFLRIRNGL